MERSSAVLTGVCLKYLRFHENSIPFIVAPEVIEQSGATTASDIWY